MPTFDEFRLWKADRLQKYLRDRGLSVRGRKEELVAVCFGAQYLNMPLKVTADEHEKERSEKYRALLAIGDTTLPDPFSDISQGWIGEARGVTMWPPTMYGDLSEYLVDKGERELRTRLLTDYKEGKAFSYFDSKWLKEVFYHGIEPDSRYCFLKAECTPSMNIANEPHQIWVCIAKKTGKVLSAYCTCFAGLGAACNHIAAVLFKLDFAWQKGYTTKACTSLPAAWGHPTGSQKKMESKRINEMPWRKPHYAKHGQDTVINPVTRQLFSPHARQHGNTITTSLESLMGSLFVSCSNASVFQYASPQLQPSYPPQDDMNVDSEIVVETSCGLAPSVKDMVRMYGESLVDSMPTLTSENIAAIEIATVNQSDSALWKEQRIGRVTSSSAHRTLTKGRKLKGNSDIGNMDNLVNAIIGEKSTDPNIYALKYGRTMEPVARKQYHKLMLEKRHKNVKIRPCGLFIHPNYIFMGASPDGIVSCDCCGTGVLEIKCPAGLAHVDPVLSPPAYLKRCSSDKLSLNRNHEYCSQVAMHMAVTGYVWCDFFVYTSHGFFLERLMKEELASLINEIEHTSAAVFQGYILPKLLSSLNAQKPQEDNSSMDTEETGDSTSMDTEVAMDIESTGATSSTSVSNNKPHPTRTNIVSLPARIHTKKKQRSTRKGVNSRPVYLCGTCETKCKNDTDIAQDSENSVGCDSCYKWYHWGCVGFDGIDCKDWFCSRCADND